MLSKKQQPTISDVAEKAGVSIATVSRVINGTTPVASETALRVQEAIKELAFVPRAAARVLASRRTETLGLLLPEIGGAFFSPLLRGIEAEAQAAGYDLLIHATSHIPHASKPVPHRPLGEHNTDGLIVFTQSIDKKELSRLYSLNFPTVLLYQSPPSPLNIPSVTIENKSGAQMIVEHLIQAHNRRRIIFLRGPEGNEDSEWRERGYREALQANGIPFDPSLVAMGGFNEEEAHVALQELLIEGVEFDAVFGGDDDTAAGVISALIHAGKRVPQDVAVVGFDDLPIARYLRPALTTVRAPIEQVGREGVRQLVRLIRGQQAEAFVLLQTEIVIRESCGCPLAQSQGLLQSKFV
ncbi:MAG: LacI family DNA-binding transcriptional regulator [Anaerolineales bacterium]|nr:LacI family DNA-binding transcriptional regulator [Anaerolineales bacterium]